jgi:hypothetical protein
MTALAQVGQLARRVDHATPPQRDRAVDALCALAIAGVIGGHWLVTALVAGGSGHGTVLHDDSPLASMPVLAPLSWIFQTLAVFFLVGGYSAARGYLGGYRTGCASASSGWLVRSRPWRRSGFRSRSACAWRASRLLPCARCYSW